MAELHPQITEAAPPAIAPDVLGHALQQLSTASASASQAHLPLADAHQQPSDGSTPSSSSTHGVEADAEDSSGEKDHDGDIAPTPARTSLDAESQLAMVEYPHGAATNPYAQSEASSLAPRTPHTAGFDAPLLPPARNHPTVSSPLNPRHPPSHLRPGAGGDLAHRHLSTASRLSQFSAAPAFARIASEESAALGLSGDGGQRGSMILYKLDLAPPRLSYAAAGNRDSVLSSSGASMLSLSADSKYPQAAAAGGGPGTPRGFVPYAFDPLAFSDPEDDDALHAPDGKDSGPTAWWSWRGVLNYLMLLILVAAMLALFVCYPVLTYFRNTKLNSQIVAGGSVVGNVVAVNATGTAAAAGVPEVPGTKRGWVEDLVFGKAVEVASYVYTSADADLGTDGFDADANADPSAVHLVSDPGAGTDPASNRRPRAGMKTVHRTQTDRVVDNAVTGRRTG